MIDVTLPVSFEKAQLTFSVNGVTAGQKIAVLHQKHDGSWEVINPDSVGNGTVTATFTSLSPIAFVAYNASDRRNNTCFTNYCAYLCSRYRSMRSKS